jgi:two-component system phosphate regulon response regulator PhoB
MAKERILIVDDEEDIVELVRVSLEKEGYPTLSAESGEKALSIARSELPDIIVLDLMMPGIDGLEVTRRIKADPATKSIFIVMLSAKGEEADIITGLELGADDYVTKPFSPKILIARIRSVLRRKVRETTLADETGAVHVSGITIVPHKHMVETSRGKIMLTPTEFNVLHLLARHPGWVFTRWQIVDKVRGEDYAVTDRSVDVQIAGLRKKLGAFGDCIETVRGVGYRFKEE